MYLNFTIDDQDKIIGEGVIQVGHCHGKYR